jgi:Cu2+-exporting ATPase
LALTDIREHPGFGVEAELEGHCYRLGRAEWALAEAGGQPESGTMLSRDGALVARFAFAETLRPQARAAVDALRADGLSIVLLSGDRPVAVQPIAGRLGIDAVSAGLLPAGKVERLAALAAEDRKVLMVGDGLNDAPALAAAHASMAPASAADIGRNAADFVFLHDGLDAVPTAIAVARAAGRLIRQNFALAILYNALALPVAIAGYVTPLIAALAMSLSSILVVANALRLDAGKAQVRAGTDTRQAGKLAPACEPGE